MLIQNCIATKARDIDEQNVKYNVILEPKKCCVSSMTTPQTEKNI